MSTNGTIILKPREEARIRGGHLWVFSNEVSRIEGTPADGDAVRVISHRGAHLGVGFFNRRSLITVRVVSRETDPDLPAIISSRILEADARRHALGYGDVYRMVNGEADHLPGLIIDRYASTSIVESYSVGMDSMMDVVRDTVAGIDGTTCIIEKSQSVWRGYEGLEPRSRFLLGSDAGGDVAIDGMRYHVHHLEGQKTGLFLDQQPNRMKLETMSRGRRVLDCCCNEGGFALHAARGGASFVLGVDSSAGAVEHAEMNARCNELSAIEFRKSDIFDFLDAEAAKSWDVVVVDPPAFVKSRKKIITGLKGYEKLNEKALRSVKDGGILVSCTCSSLVDEGMFLNVLSTAAARADRTLSVFAVSGAGPDHPFLPGMPESRYLTCVWGFVGSRE